jgi:DNA polymerase-3 subunit gamma/tau
VAAEGAEADEAALALVARLADGGMRDAESLLDQVLSFSDGRLTETDVRDAAGLADDAAIVSLVDAYVAGDASAALGGVADLADAGRDLAQVAAQAEGEARHRLLASAADPPMALRLAGVLRGLAEASGVGAREGRARLLMELLAVDGSAPVAQAAIAARAPILADPKRTDPSPSSDAPSAAASPTRRPPSPRSTARATPTVAAAAAAAAVAPGGGGDVAELRAHWADVVERATPVLKPLLRECRPVARDGARLTLAFPEGRDFMRSRIAQRAGAIEALLTDMFGGAFAIECVASNLELEPLTVEQAVGTPNDDPEAAALLEGVLKITGGELVDAPEVR